jgi:hypothetical protein
MAVPFSPTATTDVASAARCTSSFFAQYPNFVPNPRAPLRSEIDRLAIQEGWHARGKRVGRIAAYSAELALQCSGKSGLESWQALCVDTGVARIDGVPTSIKRCKKVCMSSNLDILNSSLQGTHVGFHQHLQSHRPSAQPHHNSPTFQDFPRFPTLHPTWTHVPKGGCKARRSDDRLTKKSDTTNWRKEGKPLVASIDV